MNFDDIKPFIRHTGYVKSSAYAPEGSLVSYDNCIVYTLHGKGVIIVENQEFEMHRGSVLMWRAGMKYKICNSENDPEYIFINFDFTNERCITNSFKISPDPSAIFNPSRLTDRSVFEDYPEYNSVIYTKSARHLEELFLGIVSEFKKPKNHMYMRASAKMIIILSELPDYYSLKTDTKNTDKSTEIIEYIHENYTKDLTNSDIARYFNFHPQHINKIVKRKTGYSLHKYVIMRRISKAIDLLETTKIPITEISEKIGFQNICHFSRYFKDFMGTSPRAYRQKTKK